MTKKIALIGASGRTGSKVLEALPDFPNFALHAAVVSEKSSSLGKNCCNGLVQFSSSIEDAIKGADGVIDFSTPEIATKVASLCAEYKVPLLEAVTGLSPKEQEVINQSAKKTAVAHVANTSVGVWVLSEIVSQASKLLGSDYDIEISEIHHRGKKDAPSGTAKALLKAASVGRDCEGVNRFGQSSGKRESSEIGVSSVRGGDVVGEHTVYFIGKGERLELSHKASDRLLFGRGALLLLSRLISREPGMYSLGQLMKASC